MIRLKNKNASLIVVILSGFALAITLCGCFSDYTYALDYGPAQIGCRWTS